MQPTNSVEVSNSVCGLPLAETALEPGFANLKDLGSQKFALAVKRLGGKGIRPQKDAYIVGRQKYNEFAEILCSSSYGQIWKFPDPGGIASIPVILTNMNSDSPILPSLHA